MARKWWSEPGYPQNSWSEADWRDWEKHGRPAIPRESRLPLPQYQPRGDSVAIPPPGPQPSFGLFARPRRREASAQSHAVDRLIEKVLGPR